MLRGVYDVHDSVVVLAGIGWYLHVEVSSRTSTPGWGYFILAFAFEYGLVTSIVFTHTVRVVYMLLYWNIPGNRCSGMLTTIIYMYI